MMMAPGMMMAPYPMMPPMQVPQPAAAAGGWQGSVLPARCCTPAWPSAAAASHPALSPSLPAPPQRRTLCLWGLALPAWLRRSERRRRHGNCRLWADPLPSRLLALLPLLISAASPPGWVGGACRRSETAGHLHCSAVPWRPPAPRPGPAGAPPGLGRRPAAATVHLTNSSLTSACWPGAACLAQHAPPRFRLVVPGLSASVLIALSLRIPAPRRFPLELPPTNPANHSFFPTHGFQVPLHATFWATSAVVGGPFSLPLSPLLPLPQHCLRPDTLSPVSSLPPSPPRPGLSCPAGATTLCRGATRSGRRRCRWLFRRHLYDGQGRHLCKPVAASSCRSVGRGCAWLAVQLFVAPALLEEADGRGGRAKKRSSHWGGGCCCPLPERRPFASAPLPETLPKSQQSDTTGMHLLYSTGGWRPEGGATGKPGPPSPGAASHVHCGALCSVLDSKGFPALLLPVGAEGPLCFEHARWGAPSFWPSLTFSFTSHVQRRNYTPEQAPRRPPPAWDKTLSL